MAIAPAIPIGGAADPAAAAQRKKVDPKISAAARQFEGVLVQQLIKVLWENSPTLEGASGGMYKQMFQGPLADHLTAAGGIGLSPMIERALDLKAGGASAAQATANQQVALQAAHQVAAAGSFAPSTATGSLGAHLGAPTTGQLTRIQGVAADMLEDGGLRWSKDGALQPRDLMADVGNTPSGERANANLRDLRGYQGYYKCNLFALEVARRAGFDVPMQARDTGMGYPLSNQITADAADGRMQRGWARVVTSASPGSLDQGLSDGNRALMLTGSGQEGARGHMAIVEKIHSIDRASDGSIERIVFDGWEARPDGARHLRERTWNASGNRGGHDPRNGFERIEILELKRPDHAAQGGGPANSPANTSHERILPSSQPLVQPIDSSEEES
jgi:Rod binding domain-containing protein